MKVMIVVNNTNCAPNESQSERNNKHFSNPTEKSSQRKTAKKVEIEPKQPQNGLGHLAHV